MAPLAAEELLLRPEPGEGLAVVFAKAGPGGLGVELGDGTYFIDAPIALAGRSDIRVRAKAGAAPVISGGRRITGWERVGEGRWRAVLPGGAAAGWRFRELFVGGRKATRARHPDTGSFRIAKAGADRRTSFTFAGGDIVDWADPGGVEFVFYHDWSLSRVRFASIDLESKTVTLADPVGCTTMAHYGIDHFEKHPRYHLENHEAFVTAPGEWYLDTGSGTVTYFARAGEDPNALGAIAPYAGALLRLSGCERISFEGVTFSHTNWILPPGGCAGMQAAFHQVRPAPGKYENRREAPPAAVELADCSGITFEGCRFEGLGASGLWVRNGCDSIVLKDCNFREIGANGLMIGGVAATEKTVTRAVEVSGCTIERCGTVDFGAVGIWIGIANGVTVKGNELRQLPYTGISAGWRWSAEPTPCGNILIEGNHIHHVMQKLSDGGGIYTLGRQPGTVLRGNRIHDVPVNAGRAESNGMFLDQGTTGIVIEGNTIYRVARSPLRFHRAGKNLIKGNTLYRSDVKIPMVRYNRTPEGDITLEGNRAPVGEPPIGG